MAKSRVKINFEVEDELGKWNRVELVGRFAQTLDALIRAGERGITSLEISSWALRLSHYVFILRTEHGLAISCEMEEHDGPYPGRHGRYRLETPARIAEQGEIAA